MEKYSTENEIWKPIKDFERYYEISDKGRVRSLDRYVSRSDGGTQFVEGINLVISYNPGGYAKVNLNKNGVATVGYVARLVAMHFIPNPDNKREVNHINGDKTDNRVQNLEWVTPSENIRHSLDKKLRVIQPKTEHPAAKLTKQDVKDIKSLYKTGKYTYQDLAERFGVSKATIHRMLYRW